MHSFPFSTSRLVFQHPEKLPPIEGGRESHKNIETFLGQAMDIFNKEGEKGLRDLLEKHPEYWEVIEKNLKEVDEKQRETIKRLLKEVRELQKSVVEWLPDYPAKKKVAVIINGDSAEERHTGNTERAIRMLRKQGFTEILVAQHAPVKDKTGIRQYPGDKAGIDKLFADMEKTLIKDSLVFVYGTGHGSPDENGAISLDQPIGVDEVRAYMRVIKQKESRMVGVFDSCYSGVFPKALIEEEGLEGIVVSPGMEGKETGCQFFAPYFFEGLEKGSDLNKDRKTEVSEAFITAMQIYRHRMQSEAYGEYMSSKTELTSKNFDRVMQSGKTVIIDINATWCGPCKILSQNLSRVTGMVGEQVEVVTVTDDTNPEAKELYKKLRAEPQGFPTVLIKKAGETTAKPAFIDVKSYQEIIETLKSGYGVEINEAHFRKKLTENFIKENPGKEREIRSFMKWYGPEKMWFFDALDDNLFKQLFQADTSPASKSPEQIIKSIEEAAIKKIAEKDPRAALEYADRYKDQPYAKAVIRSAAEKYPWYVLKYADRYKDQPYYAEVLEKAARSAAEKDPRYALEYADRYKDQPYAKEVLLEAIEKEVGNNPNFDIKNNPNLKMLPYYQELVKAAKSKKK